MRWAVAGPTPGRVSSCASVAVFRLTGPAAVVAPPSPPVPGGGVTPTTTSSPSTSLRARFTNDRSVPGNAPPAASMASATREPVGSRTNPGRYTRPATATTMTPLPAVDVPKPVAGADVSTRAVTGSGRGRANQATPAPTATATRATTARARTPRRPGPNAR